MGRMRRDAAFRREVIKVLDLKEGTIHFKHPDISVQATCYEKNIPLAIHAGIGTDVLDQHYWFEGEPKEIRESLFHCFTGRLWNSYN